MNKKINVIIFALVALSFISMGVALVMFSGKAMVTQKYNEAQRQMQQLQAEYQAQGERLLTADSEKRKLSERLKAINDELDAANKSINDLNQRFATTEEEKAGLLAKIEELGKAPQGQPQGQPPSGASVQDEYWASMVKENAEMKLSKDSLEKTINELQTRYAEAQSHNDELQLKLQELSQNKEDIQRQFDYNRRLVETLASDLVREKDDAKTIKRQIKTLKEENDVLSGQLKQMMASKISLEKKVNGFEEEKAALQNRLSNVGHVLNQRLEELIDIQKQAEIGSVDVSAGAKESVELPPIVVKSKGPEAVPAPAAPSPQQVAAPATMSGFTGQVVSIDEKNNFVIIDAGKNKGIQTGQVFDVYGGSKKVAVLEVVQVRDDISACDITQLTGRISVGDKIR